MPTFYFSIHQADGSISDDLIGSDFGSAQQARDQATQALSEMAMDIRPERGVTRIEIRVRDATGREIARRSAQFDAEDFEVE
ncbi:DUF6894 family protein [Devosia oryzisoli]|nr:hypothetical protein [Devosia oryzisoli]